PSLLTCKGRVVKRLVKKETVIQSRWRQFAARTAPGIGPPRAKCYNTNSMRERATATLSTIVVDDEQLACDELSYLLKDFPEIDVIATASNGLEAMDLIRKMEPELIFLDVNMPGLDGMGVVRQLREKGVELPHVIFVTAYDQYAVEAFRLEALDYLLKPIDKVRLAESVDRARRAVQERKAPELPSPGPSSGAAPAAQPAPRNKLAVRCNNRHFIVDANDV